MIVATYKGYEIRFDGPGYSCARIKAFGYARDTQVKAQIRKYIKRQESKQLMMRYNAANSPRQA